MAQTQQFIIRTTDYSIAFVQSKGGSETMEYEEYTVKRGMAMAANMREAFRESPLLRDANGEITLLTDNNVLLVPDEEYDEGSIMEQYKYVFPDSENIIIKSTMLPSLHTIAVFAIDKDLATVLTDHFSQIHIEPLMARVWDVLLQRQDTYVQEKLYVYLHESKIEIASFLRRRFVFANVFAAESVADTAYFICGAWQQVNAHSATDSVVVCGEINDSEALCTELQPFIHNITLLDTPILLGKNKLPLPTNVPLDLLLHLV